MELSDIRQVLIINLGGIGDFLLSSPALDCLSRRFPGASFDVLCVERVMPLASDMKLFRKEYCLPGNLAGYFSALSELRRARYDLAVNMRTLATDAGALKILFLLSVIHPAVKAGRDTNGRGWFLDSKLSETDPGAKHELDYDLDTVRMLGAEGVFSGVRVPVNSEAELRIENMLKEAGFRPDERLVGINPGGMASRRWPADNFQEMMRQISAKAPCRFVITGDKQEAALARRLSEQSNAINLAGRCGVRELIAVIGKCDLFITNDTGPMHIAAALGIRLIALFGPGQLTRFDPRRIASDSVVFYKPADCAPCEKKWCRDQRCLTTIKPDEAAMAAVRLLSERGHTR